MKKKQKSKSSKYQKNEKIVISHHQHYNKRLKIKMIILTLTGIINNPSLYKIFRE